MFSCFNTTSTCERQTQGHSIYCASIASCCKNAFLILCNVHVMCIYLLCFRMDMDDDDELDGDIGFEAELAMLDEVEADMRSVGEGPEAVSTSTRWSRPPVPSFDSATDALVFQQFDIDFHSGIKPMGGTKVVENHRFDGSVLPPMFGHSYVCCVG